MTSNFDMIAEKAYSIGVDQLESEVSLRGQTDEMLKLVMNALNDFEQKYTEYKKLLIQKRQLKKSEKVIPDELREEIKRWQEPIYSSFFNFQNLFNEYFNQIIKMVFVYKDNNNELTLGISENNLDNLIMNQYGKLSYDIKNLEKELILENEDYDSVLLDETANSIYERWDIAKSTTGKSTWLPILWKIGEEWRGANVNNKGTIAEAYANFYLNKIIFSGDLENRVEFYITDNKNGMFSVDNTLGFFIGDVNRGQVQYAIKSQGASPMGMARVYEYIKKIKNTLGQEASEENILEALKEKVSVEGRVKQVKMLSENIEKTYQDLIKNYLQ